MSRAKFRGQLCREEFHEGQLCWRYVCRGNYVQGSKVQEKIVLEGNLRGKIIRGNCSGENYSGIIVWEAKASVLIVRIPLIINHNNRNQTKVSCKPLFVLIQQDIHT